MIRRAYAALPGPTAARVAASVGIVAVLLVGLHFFYEWLGGWLLDSGGTVG
ncbi:MAG TPA: hypothetical protein VGC11_06950 [Acidimicrobiia bacterium]|jgi:hypothetical protein